MSEDKKSERPPGGGQPNLSEETRPRFDPSKLERLPVSRMALEEYFGRQGEANPFALRKETFLRIERVTGRPLICYLAKTHSFPTGVPAYIDDSDLSGFGDLIYSVDGENIDILIVSNGGSVEATERIVRLIRDRFASVRFVVPGNAYSAATLMCFSADDILMGPMGTLGPIDPQINGVPARAILRAFETIETRLKEEGPRALTAYMPLISKYDLHILEICKSAQELSKDLAGNWLRRYMLKCNAEDPRPAQIVDYFSDYDARKSHGRSIDRKTARDLGLKVTDVEDVGGLAELVRSLHNQYELWFDKLTFYKVFENARGINWGRRSEAVSVQLPVFLPPGIPQPTPQPGPPERST
jgi:hypothetical protein